MARLLVACGLLLSIACGPSLKQAQTREERYERCYAADYDPAIAPDQRAECWRQWLENDAADQPPDRIAHARTRLLELSQDGHTLPLPDDRPEPATARKHPYPRSTPAVYPTSSCDPLCDRRWADCNSYCEMRDKSCLAACESEYRVCVGGCP